MLITMQTPNFPSSDHSSILYRPSSTCSSSLSRSSTLSSTSPNPAPTPSPSYNFSPSYPNNTFQSAHSNLPLPAHPSPNITSHSSSSLSSPSSPSPSSSSTSSTSASTSTWVSSLPSSAHATDSRISNSSTRVSSSRTTLAATAPTTTVLPSSCAGLTWAPFPQAGGHSIIWKLGQDRIVKPSNQREVQVYKILQKFTKLRPFLAGFFGSDPPSTPGPLSPTAPTATRSCSSPATSPTYVLRNETTRRTTYRPGYFRNQKSLIVLEDLTAGYEHACVMDLKIGKICVPSNIDDMKRRKSKTKAHATTTSSMGLRVGGIRVFQPYSGRWMIKKGQFGKRVQEHEFEQVLKLFLCDGVRIRYELIPIFIEKLKALLDVLIFYKEHCNFIASSVLLIYDGLPRPLTSVSTAPGPFVPRDLNCTFAQDCPAPSHQDAQSQLTHHQYVNVQNAQKEDHANVQYFQPQEDWVPPETREQLSTSLPTLSVTDRHVSFSPAPNMNTAAIYQVPSSPTSSYAISSSIYIPVLSTPDSPSSFSPHSHHRSKTSVSKANDEVSIVNGNAKVQIKLVDFDHAEISLPSSLNTPIPPTVERPNSTEDEAFKTLKSSLQPTEKIGDSGAIDGLRTLIELFENILFSTDQVPYHSQYAYHHRHSYAKNGGVDDELSLPNVKHEIKSRRRSLSDTAIHTCMKTVDISHGFF